jgi:predicted HTH domain antitoxin
MEAVITLPETILSSIKIRKSDLNQFLRRTLAVALYREGRLSLGKAAELAGVRNKWEMILLLDEKGVPLDYDAADAEVDLSTLRSYLGRQKE